MYTHHHLIIMVSVWLFWLLIWTSVSNVIARFIIKIPFKLTIVSLGIAVYVMEIGIAKICRRKVIKSTQSELQSLDISESSCVLIVY